ncbi:MAG: orotate phosphoribosyltransferase [Oscillospiraceae bacterium]|nr:orotate phosphoribosyltransferase [Oscillospiraceae bacterium]
MTNLSRQIAADLLQIQAVFLRPEEPFTWASGIQSPIYCDNRVTYAEPEVRRRIAEGYVQVIREKYPACEAVIGTSTSGIGYAALAAWLMELPTGYVRGGAKSHGRGNKIEGRVTPGQKVVVVEDTISTGGSVIEVVEILREAGADVLGIVSIFTYEMQKGKDRLAEAQIENTSLTDFGALVEVAAQTGYLDPKAIAALKAFRDNPGDAGWLGMLG